MKSKDFIIGFVLFILLAVCGYFLLKYLFRYLANYSIQTITPLISLSIPVIVAIVTVYLGRRLEMRKSQEEKLREFKVPIYNEFLDYIIKYVVEKKASDSKANEEMITFLKNITPKMMIWADDLVIKKWAEFRLSGNETEKGNNLTMLRFEEIILAMRKDLGHKNKNLKNHELLKCFINDLDNHLDKNKKN